jgi:predicted GNAT family N-acyltransferase
VTVRLESWQAASQRLAFVRRAVFINEQHVPEALEWDDADAHAVHALAESATGIPVGTARLLPDHQIGRMAVLGPWRGAGVGSALLRALIGVAVLRGAVSVQLNAQVRAIPFYERFGFEAHGAVFDDAGIPHRAMTLRAGPHR